jgi:hypothetical protein
MLWFQRKHATRHPSAVCWLCGGAVEPCQKGSYQDQTKMISLCSAFHGRQVPLVARGAWLLKLGDHIVQLNPCTPPTLPHPDVLPKRLPLAPACFNLCPPCLNGLWYQDKPRYHPFIHCIAWLLFSNKTLTYLFVLIYTLLLSFSISLGGLSLLTLFIVIIVVVRSQAPSCVCVCLCVCLIDQVCSRNAPQERPLSYLCACFLFSQ